MSTEMQWRSLDFLSNIYRRGGAPIYYLPKFLSKNSTVKKLDGGSLAPPFRSEIEIVTNPSKRSPNLWNFSDGLRIFPRWGHQPSSGANIQFCQIFPKLHEIVRIWNGGCASKILLCRSATEFMVESLKATIILSKFRWKSVVVKVDL